MKIDEMIETVHILFKIIVVIRDEGGVQPKLVDPYNKWRLVVKTRNWHKHSFDMHTSTLLVKLDFVTGW